MQKITITIIMVFSTAVLYGQTNFEKFKKLLESNDTAKIKTLLNEWEKTNPNDPELYNSAFNFYFIKSKQEVLSIQKENPQKESLQLNDSGGKVAGFLTSDIGYSEVYLEKALKYINKGIEKFPKRLDLRFGKIYVLGLVGEYTIFTEEVIKTVEYSTIVKCDWLWTENKKQEDGQNFMLENVQAYMKQLYDTEDDSLLLNIIQIGEATLKYYPKKVEILSTTSVALMLIKQFDKAISYLKEAEKIAPHDYIVLNNIAHCFKLKGDKENAIKYYQLTEKYGDEESKQTARKNIEQLNK